MKGYKGFNKDLQCTPSGKVFQYEIGKEYQEDSADLCNNGFHFCENPLEIFNYYSPTESRYAEIEAENVSDERGDDTKRCSKNIKINAEIGLKGIINAGVKFIFEKSEHSTTGDGANAATKHRNTISAAIGIEGIARGAIGSWLVLADWKYNDEVDYYEVKNVQTIQVDGERIKENTFYKLCDGEFIETNEY